MNRISFLGYGRFGAALGERLREAGLSVRAMDPHAPVPDEARIRTSSLVRKNSLSPVLHDLNRARNSSVR